MRILHESVGLKANNNGKLESTEANNHFKTVRNRTGGVRGGVVEANNHFKTVRNRRGGS
jgi:hypothetical protein